MAQDDQTTASLAAKLRAEIRADIEAGLRIPRPAVPPVQPQAVRPAAAFRLPAIDGRPELRLPAGTETHHLSLPPVIAPGLTVSYSAGDSLRVEDIEKSYAGTEIINVHFVFTSPTLIALDVRPYTVADPRAFHVVSSGCRAVTGDGMCSGIAWIHPTLLEGLSGNAAPEQADGVKVERVPFKVEHATFNAVRISEQGRDWSSRLVYDLETGLLLFQSSSKPQGLNRLHVQRTYVSRRQTQLPWAQQPPPAWVATTRHLTFEGSNTIQLAGTSLRQSVVLTAGLEELNPGVLMATLSSITSLGPGYPDDRITWNMVCASSMLYPLWIAPQSLRAMTPQQAIDRDPVTGFRMTFAGIEGDRAALVEEGPLERTTYYFDVRDGLLSGFRGQRPYGDGGGQMYTESWFKRRS